MTTAPTGPVLIVTMADDSHADMIVEELGRRQVPVARFHTEDFPARSSISLFPVGNGLEWDGIIATQGREIRLSEVRSAWYRRPEEMGVAESVPPGLVDYSIANARDVLHAAYALIEHRWLASPHRLRLAELKPIQVMAAARVGLRIPQTMFSNDYRRVTAFRRDLAGRDISCAVKSLTTTKVMTHDKKIWFPYTTIWSGEDSPDMADSIGLTCAIYQEYMPRSLDIRIVVLGDQTFGACVDPSSDPDSVYDVRKGDLTRQWKPYDVPPEVAAALVTVTQALGLRFCSADFILTPDGELVFLELNPNGQWLWLDLYAGLPLVEKFADYFAAGIGPPAPACAYPDERGRNG
jgi:glutathione synthase/RimK-type ligase-like ATP-grasp enzyme